MASTVPPRQLQLHVRRAPRSGSSSSLNVTRSTKGPLENISEWLTIAGFPSSQALISIGATRYTDLGESTFLEVGDRSIVAVYDAKRHDGDAVRRFASSDSEVEDDGISLLRQEVV